MKRIVAASILVFAAGLALVSLNRGITQKSEPSHHIPFPVLHDWNSVRIALERTGCLGTCPVYRVEVHGDGTVLYDGLRWVALEGKHRGSVPRKNVEELVTKFREVNYYSLADEYAPPGTDLPGCETSIEIDGHIKRVRDYWAFDRLENAIDQLANTERWTKGNGETVAVLREERWGFKTPEARRTLARVAKYGTADAVRDMITAGVPPTPEALATALRLGKCETALVLLRHGVNANSRDAYGNTMLMDAAGSGVPAVVRELLKGHVNVNARDKNGRTALMDAVGRVHLVPEAPPISRTEVVRLLLQAGADPNAADKDGNTALIEADRDAGAALLLIKAGANVNARNTAGDTPLIRAHTIDVMQSLLDNGADVSARDKDGKTALDLAKLNNNETKVAALEAAQAARKPSGTESRR
jgi:ankyrin repeat protein